MFAVVYLIEGIKEKIQVPYSKFRLDFLFRINCGII